MRCDFCKTYFEPRRSDARFCSAAHKAAWHRAEERRERETAIDLLLRQTKAVQDGDLEALSAIAEEAARLLPKDRP